MVESRTIKTLVALLVAMTVGSMALVLMETAPAHPPVTHLAAVANPADDSSEIISQTTATLRAGKWRNIVVHTSAEGLDSDHECHFVVEPTASGEGRCARATVLWKGQNDGTHVFAAGHNWNSDSIGVYVVGDFARIGPTRPQFQALLSLVRSLQQTCGITADRVYLSRDIDPRGGSPGPAFPVTLFNNGLLKPAAH